MAGAYVSVGQMADARICLEPLLAEGDPEAHAMARRAQRSEAPAAASASETRDDKRSSKPAAAAPAHEQEEELMSSEMLLEGEDEAAHELDGLESEEDDDAKQRDSLADELSDLRAHLEDDVITSAGSPLADLAVLASRHDSRELSDGLSQLLQAGELSELQADLDADSDHERDDLLDSREELLDSGELSTVHDSSERTLPAQDEQERPYETPRLSSTPPRLPTQSKEPPRARVAELEFQLPPEDEEHDPFAEKTQPRVTPLTLAELTALTSDDAFDARARNVIMAPAGELHGRDPDSEVTTLTPAEDPAVTELRSLRTELAKRLRFRDRRGAAEVAQTLLERGVFDAEAIEALEEHFRLARDFRGLRDLSMRLARELSFPPDVRSARLREAVMLSESKLGDQEGATLALRELLALEPHDADAFEKLKKLLKRGQHWDELALLFGQREAEIADPKERAELLRELGALQREKRSAAEPAIAAYTRARELDPDQPDDEVALSELYAGSGHFAEAASMYEARAARLEPSQRGPLLTRLAQLYEEKLNDDERAQRSLEALRALEPRKLEPLHALIRVLERRGEHRALVSALTDQLALAAPADRVRLHVRIAEVTLAQLGDASQAANSYAEAIGLTPQDETLWRAAGPAFEQAGRSSELDQLLWSLAQGGRDRALSSALFEYLARTRAARADLGGAILAREAQFAVTQDAAVLAALVALLRDAERPSDLARRLDELARRSERDAARSLRLERADVLAQQLRDPEAAKAELELLLAELAADDANALRKLVELCIATGDTKRRASAQERLIKLAPSLPARIELAVELVDIYEHELHDQAGAARVLSTWTALEPENPTPYVRLAPLLAQAGRKRELLDTLDKLTALANSDEEAGEFLLRAARVAMELEDFDGAWNRLVPRVVDKDDAAAERLLRELTKLSGRGEQLAAVYVGLAQRTEDPEVEKRRWADAARVFEQEVSAYDRALEAMLRALAKQLDNRELLGEVERLAGRAQAWPRLAQVYDTIVRRAETTDVRIQLLMRHARLLEQHASDPATAFERVWLAYQLDPSIDETYAEARRLAVATGKQEELLGAYERRAQSTASREARIEALLEACALAQHDFEDTARATGYLARAVALAADAAPLLDMIEARVRALDAAQPPIDGRGLLAELTGVYGQLAQENPRMAALAATWLSRSARIHELKLDDPDAAFRALERASSLTPGDETLLDELTRVATLGRNWEALAKHLQHAADVAIDSNSSSAALSRLGLLCERELGSPSRAADAYEQLVRLRPKDADASRRLRHCLRASDRFDELLIAIDRELFMLKPEDGKRELLKQAAETWEFGLKNRYEALDAWKKVASLAPADPDAQAALSRLRSRPRADDSLLDDDLVVLPEDLRPSLIEMPASTLLSASAAGVSSSFFGEQKLAESEPSEPVDDVPEHGLTDTSSAGSSTPDDAAPEATELAQGEAAHDHAPAANDAEPTDHLDAASDEPPEGHADEAQPDDDGLDALIAQTASLASPESVLASDDAHASDGSSEEHGVANEVTQAARRELAEPLSQHDEGEVTDHDDEHEELDLDDSLTHSGSIDLSDSLHDYEADVTLPLERDERRQETAISLEGLSSLLVRAPTQPPPPPPPRPASRVPPPPPRPISKPPADD
ncbi:MAG: domain protein putative component of TonB system [Myxococcaceae bacterium]|nr:domain protein putative component of TonB system [Myxococcaceae bacterium]